MNHATRQHLRQVIRLQREGLSQKQQQNARQALLAQVIQSELFQTHNKLAFYFAHRGEIDPLPLMQLAWQLHKHCYLPVLHPTQPKQLCFVRYQAGEMLHPNRYGIKEPRLTQKNLIEPSQLDLIFLPLVAFDQQGNRLGMGGGYYDHTLGSTHKPPLIGLAHPFQHVKQLPPTPWDVKLDAVLTPETWYRFDNKE